MDAKPIKLRRHYAGGRLACLVVFAIALGVAPLRGQSVGSGTIDGRLTDETSGSLPGVTVTISSPAMQLGQLTAQSAADGNYRFVDLPIGLYRIQYELSGFQTVVREGVRVNAGFVARIDVVLKVGSVAETVTVS